MSRPEDWSKTADNLAMLMQYTDMDAEEARDIFESIHGFRPNTGKPTPVTKRTSRRLKRWWQRWFS